MEFICDNEKGERIKFGNMAPFWLVSVNGLGSDFNVYTSKNSGQDGENYNGSDAQKRNIVLTLELSLRDYEEQMKKLYHFFPKDKSGTLICCGSELRKIRYYVEKVEPESETFLPAGSSPYETKNVMVSLVCPDPKFYAFDDQLTQLAVWKGRISFPLKLPPQINAKGQHVTLTVDDSIKNYDKAEITGQTVQGGTGNPSSNNVRPLYGTTALTITGGNEDSQVAALPAVLYGLPDGTSDSYDATGGQGTQKIGKMILNGSENWLSFNVNTVRSWARLPVDAVYSESADAVPNMMCDKYPVKSPNDVYHTANAVSLNSSIVLSLTPDLQTLDAFKAKIASSPVTVLYERGTPQLISGTLSVPIYHPTTTLSLDAGTISIRAHGKFSVTDKINTLIGNVQNDSTVEMGLTVAFRASGTVVNPSLYDVNRQLLMKIHKTMGSGDVIVITTGDGNKRVKLISGGVTTNINNLMQYPPKWLKACPGDNLLRYNADSGIDNLSVSILSTQAYWGV